MKVLSDIVVKLNSKNWEKVLFFFCFIIFTTFSNAQSKKVWLEHADNYFKKGDYNSALKYYKDILSDSVIQATEVIPYEVGTTSQRLKDKKKSDQDSAYVPYKFYLTHQIAVCYRKIFDYKNAVIQYNKTANSSYYPQDKYYLGESLMKAGKYDSALVVFNSYIKQHDKSDPLLSAAIQKVIACKYATNDESFRKEVSVKLADTSVFNKGTSSFGVMYFGSEDKVLFSSARANGVILDPKTQDSRYLDDLYWSEKENDSTWGKAFDFGRPLNSALNDASGCFTSKGVVFYNRWSNREPSKVKMFLARMMNMKFFEAYQLDSLINYPNSQNINPFVVGDSLLYFSSNRPGGLGGFDIWRVKINAHGDILGQPENIGAPVNSKMDERTPFFESKSSTLFFSSDGHNSIGGLDMFKSRYYQDADRFGKIENLGKPINSSKDDAYLIWDNKLKTGFLSSDRQPCEGGHCYDIYEVKNAPIHIYLEGNVFDEASNEIIKGANLTFKDVRSKFPDFTIYTDSNGHYKLELQQQWEIYIVAKKKNYFADATNIDTKPITATTTLHHDFYLKKIPPHEINIPGIEYDFNSAKLRDTSMRILDKLKKFLVLNSNIKIELSAHTDSRGSDSYNLKLSQERAESCVKYLVSVGINKDRLVPKGYGETEPATLMDENGKPILDKEGNKITLTDEFIYSHKSKKVREKYHQTNRRTTFKVIGQ